MGNELIIPDIFKTQRPAAALAASLPAPQDDSLADGIGQSYPVISYRGKNWQVRYRGERKTVIRPDDGTPAAHIDVVILGQAPHKSKSFFEKFDQNALGERPICSSIDGVVPDQDVQQKQATACAICPRNVWKTMENGRRGRECTDYKRLAVLMLPTQTKLLFGQPLMEPMFLRIPPASLNALAIMGETMANNGWHYTTFVTRITFDPSKAHPEMVFNPIQGLSDAEAAVILKIRQDPQVDRITGMDQAAERSQQQLGNQAIQGAQQLPPPAATGLTVANGGLSTPAAPLAPSATEKPSGLSASAPPATPPQPSVLTPTPTPPPVSPGLTTVDTGFGGAAFVTPQVPSQPVQPSNASSPQTISDTGPAEESDEEMDRRIAAMITLPK